MSATPITEATLAALGFKHTRHNGPPWNTWERDGIVIWDFNGAYWLVNALDQAGIDVRFTSMEQLSLFWEACGRTLDLTTLS